MGDVDGWTPSDHLGRDERDNVRPTPIDFPFPSTSLSVYFYPKTAEIKKNVADSIKSNDLLI